jgi:hypothetical protein
VYIRETCPRGSPGKEKPHPGGKVLSIVWYPDTVGLKCRRFKEGLHQIVIEGPKTKKMGTGQVLFHSIEGNEGAYG